MDNALLKGLEGFERVWQRVSGGSDSAIEVCTPCGTEAERLREQIDKESELAMLSRQLQRRYSCGGRVLTSIAATADEHVRLLQLEYFLKTGDTYSTAACCANRSGILVGLRECYIIVCSNERTYSELESISSGRTRELYSRLTADECRQEQILLGLISKLIR